MLGEGTTRKGKEVDKVKKAIFHAGKEEGEYRVVELERNENNEIYLRIRHGVKGGDRESMAMRLGYDELAGFSYRLEKLLYGGKGKATIYHEKEEQGYKVGEVEITSEGDIFFRMSEGVKGDKENRKMMSLRMSEDELAGLWVGARRILLS